MPVLCVCTSAPDPRLAKAATKRFRAMRPSVSECAKLLSERRGIPPGPAKLLAEACRCDLRQAELQLEMAVRSSCKGVYVPDCSGFEFVPDALAKLFSSKMAWAEVSVKRGGLLDLEAPVFDNFGKLDGLPISRCADMLDALSLADSMRSESEEMRVALPCAVAAPAVFSSRPT